MNLKYQGARHRLNEYEDRAEQEADGTFNILINGGIWLEVIRSDPNFVYKYGDRIISRAATILLLA